jgi:ABC-2 type transport system permease protein
LSAETAVNGASAVVLSGTRPLYWSIRREVWENRSVYLAPLAVAGLVLFALLLGLLTLPGRLAGAADAAQQYAFAIRPFRTAPAPIMLASFVVGIFYAVDALYGERRDRSILFWKSLPVSDRTTVLAKAIVPVLLLPLIAFTLSLAVLVILLLPVTVILVGTGTSAARLWLEVLLEQPPIMFYGLFAHALWFAPIYAWLLLVSVWARRTPFLWAATPIVLAIVERVAFQTADVAAFLKWRVVGAMAEAFIPGPAAKGNVTLLVELDPLGFVGSPGLWIGFAAAAVLLAATVRLRRYRDPI